MAFSRPKLARFCDLQVNIHMLKLVLSKLYAGIAQRYRSHCLSLLVLAAFFLAGGELDLQFYTVFASGSLY